MRKFIFISYKIYGIKWDFKKNTPVGFSFISNEDGFGDYNNLGELEQTSIKRVLLNAIKYVKKYNPNVYGANDLKVSRMYINYVKIGEKKIAFNEMIYLLKDTHDNVIKD